MNLKKQKALIKNVVDDELKDKDYKKYFVQ